MLCVLYEAVNKALIDYKSKMCAGKEGSSYDKTFALLGKGKQ